VIASSRALSNPTYRTSSAAFEAVARMVSDEPSALERLAVVEFDATGAPVGELAGDKLAVRVRHAALHEASV
jgi:hypothetical protein